MKPLLRPLALTLVLILCMTFGCSAPGRCQRAEEPSVSVDEKDALRQKLFSARPSVAAAKAPALKVVVIDVGQGDSILLVSPEGKTMLVDAGPYGVYDRIAEALNANGVTSLDVVVATHPHEDHIGSMAAVLDAYDVGAFYTIASEQPTGSYAAMLAALERDGCPVLPAEGLMEIPWAESCTVSVLSPIASYEDAPANLNDRFVVLHVRYGDTAIRLTCDAEALAENRMLDTYPRSMLKADVLKLGHHGSSSSTSYAFLLAVDPDFAVASCGKDNDFGHPHLETLSLLYDTHTAFYCTDRDGSVTFLLDGETVSVNLP